LLLKKRLKPKRKLVPPQLRLPRRPAQAPVRGFARRRVRRFDLDSRIRTVRRPMLRIDGSSFHKPDLVRCTKRLLRGLRLLLQLLALQACRSVASRSFSDPVRASRNKDKVRVPHPARIVRRCVRENVVVRIRRALARRECVLRLEPGRV
jgi:hypothetical protein